MSARSGGSRLELRMAIRCSTRSSASAGASAGAASHRAGRGLPSLSVASQVIDEAGCSAAPLSDPSQTTFTYGEPLNLNHLK